MTLNRQQAPVRRRQALNALSSLAQRSGNAEARAVLEAVLEIEPELAAELRIADALAEGGR